MITKTTRKEIEYVERKAVRESFSSGTFQEIYLRNLAEALREVLRCEDITPECIKTLQKRSIDNFGTAGSNVGMGRYDGFNLALKIVGRK